MAGRLRRSPHSSVSSLGKLHYQATSSWLAEMSKWELLTKARSHFYLRHKMLQRSGFLSLAGRAGGCVAGRRSMGFRTGLLEILENRYLPILKL